MPCRTAVFQPRLVRLPVVWLASRARRWDQPRGAVAHTAHCRSLKKNRLSFIRKGGLHHTSYLARTTMGDTSSGNAQKLVRSWSGVLFVLCGVHLLIVECVRACVCATDLVRRQDDVPAVMCGGVFQARVFLLRFPGAVAHVRSPSNPRRAPTSGRCVQQGRSHGPRVRSTPPPAFVGPPAWLMCVCGVPCRDGSSTKRAHASWCRFMVEEVTQGIMSNDSNSNATQAQKKARSIASANGWRIRGDGVA